MNENVNEREREEKENKGEGRGEEWRGETRIRWVGTNVTQGDNFDTSNPAEVR